MILFIEKHLGRDVRHVNAGAGNGHFHLVTAVIFEVLDLQPVIARGQIHPGIVETAAVPVKVPDELAVQEELGAVVRDDGKLVEAVRIDLHETLENDAEVVLALLDRIRSEDGHDTGLFHGSGQTFLK